MFTVDGLHWNIPCDITRNIRIQDSDISGQLLNGQFFHDVEGTYYDYDITLTPNPHQMGEYYTLIELLSQPVDGHKFVFPYNRDTIQVTAKVDEPKDVWVRMPNGGVYWKGLQFTASANYPTNKADLNETIQRGLTPLPNIILPQIGDVYIYTLNGWEEFQGYPDADITAY